MGFNEVPRFKSLVKLTKSVIFIHNKLSKRRCSHAILGSGNGPFYEASECWHD